MTYHNRCVARFHRTPVEKWAGEPRCASKSNAPDGELKAFERPRLEETYPSDRSMLCLPSVIGAWGVRQTHGLRTDSGRYGGHVLETPGLLLPR